MEWSGYFWHKVTKLAKRMSYSDAYNYYRRRYQETGLKKYTKS